MIPRLPPPQACAPRIIWQLCDSDAMLAEAVECNLADAVTAAAAEHYSDPAVNTARVLACCSSLCVVCMPCRCSCAWPVWFRMTFCNR